VVFGGGDVYTLCEDVATIALQTVSVPDRRELYHNKTIMKPGAMAHACNLSYSGGSRKYLSQKGLVE
jgi:hypothetical protein